MGGMEKRSAATSGDELAGAVRLLVPAVVVKAGGTCCSIIEQRGARRPADTRL